MADLSKIRLSNITYNFKDSVARTAIDGMISFEAIIVNALPTANINNRAIYFKSNNSSGNNAYDEYMYINNKWEQIGSTSIDLSNYLQTSDIAAWAKADNKPTYTAAEVDALPNTTVIPSKISDLTNDSGYLTLSTLPKYDSTVV